MKVIFEESTSIMFSVIDRGGKGKGLPKFSSAAHPLLKLLYVGVSEYFLIDTEETLRFPDSFEIYIPNADAEYEGYSLLAYNDKGFQLPRLVGWSRSEKGITAKTIFDDLIPPFDVTIVVTQRHPVVPEITTVSVRAPAQWQPSQGQLVKVEGARGIYRIEDIDVYEGTFILSEADSARRHRNNGRASREEFGAPRHYRDDAYIGGTPVPFDKVRPFYLPL